MHRHALSVIVPCFNEADNLPVLHDRLTLSCRDAVGDDYEIIYVNDGSSDASWSIIHRILQVNAHVVGINLSRNFGHQAAVTAGLEHAHGDFCFLIDADLQDPPELLKPMLDKLRAEQADVVYGQRTKRKGESRFKLATAAAFYRLLRAASDIQVPADTGDFRLVTRRVVEMLRLMPEQQRFLRGMVSWVGFRQVPFSYERQQRLSGTSKYPLGKMFRFSMDAFTGFSIAPLRISTFVALISMGVAIVLAFYIIIGLLSGKTVPGWASVMASVVLFSSVQLFVLGILGEYIGRLMLETKRRPLFVIDCIAHQGTFQVEAKIEERRCERG
jgi:polyisoprenyl-phosphate glycosyltransferase